MNASGIVIFAIATDGQNENDTVEAGSPLIQDTWTRITVWHDAANNEMGIQVGNQSAVTGPVANGPPQTVRDIQWFTNGSSSGGRTDYGQCDETSIWAAKVLSQAERNELLTQDTAGNTYPW